MEHQPLLANDVESTHADTQSIDSIDEPRTIEYNGCKVHLYPHDFQKNRTVLLQVIVCICIFSLVGANGQSTGSLMPRLLEHYNVDHSVASYIFIAQVFGFTTAAFFNDALHHLLGARGVLFGSSLISMLCYYFLSTLPESFTVFVICFYPIGLCVGLIDSTSNIMFGNLRNHKNEILGILHGIFGLSSMATPPLVAYFIKAGAWQNFYYVPMGFCVFGVIMFPIAFRFETPSKYKYVMEHTKKQSEEPHSNESTMKRTLKTPAVLIHAIYLIFYFGGESSVGAWLFSYLLEVKHGEEIAMAYVVSSFWFGLMMGRFLLGFVTKRFFKTEYLAGKCYGILALVFFSIFVATCWIPGSQTYYLWTSVAFFFSGAFLGPMFPTANVVTLQILPRYLHVSGMGCAVAMGGVGGAFLPWLIGTVSGYTGMGCFPYLCGSYFLLLNVMWIIYPKLVIKPDVFYGL